jgi:hypothetical protein
MRETFPERLYRDAGIGKRRDEWTWIPPGVEPVIYKNASDKSEKYGRNYDRWLQHPLPPAPPLPPQEPPPPALDAWGRDWPDEGDPPLDPNIIRGRYVSADLRDGTVAFHRQTYETYKLSFLLPRAISKLLGFSQFNTKPDWITWGYGKWGARWAPHLPNLTADTSIHSFWIWCDIVEGTACGCDDMYFPLLRVIPANVSHYHVYHNFSVSHARKVNRHVIESIKIKIFEEDDYETPVDIFSQTFFRLEFSRVDGE